MNSNTHSHRLPQTHITIQTHGSLARNSYKGGMGSSSPDLLRFQIFTVSVSLSETHSPPENSKSQLDILCALLFYANRSECWSSETFHVMSYNLTTSCCSAQGKEDGILWGWKKGREGGKREQPASVEWDGSPHLRDWLATPQKMKSK